MNTETTGDINDDGTPETVQQVETKALVQRLENIRTRTSETTFGKEKVNVTHTEPGLDEIRQKISDARIARMIVDTLNRHHFLPAVRSAGEVMEGTFKSKTEEGQKREQERAVAMAERIENGETFDILEFLPDERESIPAELKPFWQDAQKYLETHGETLRAAGKTVTVEDVAKKMKARHDEVKKESLF